jgi:hypothetical protein
MVHLSGHRLSPLSYSRREPTPTPPWVSGDTRQQGSFSEGEEVEEQRERGQRRDQQDETAQGRAISDPYIRSRLGIHRGSITPIQFIDS